MLEKINKEIMKISEKIIQGKISQVNSLSAGLSTINFWEIIGKPSDNIFPRISQKNN